MKYTKQLNFTLESTTKMVAFFCGLFVLLPFKLKPFTVLAIVILGLYSIIKHKNIGKIDLKAFLIYNIFTICYAVSLFFSDNIHRATTMLWRCTPLLIVPFFYSLLTVETKIQFNKIFRKTFIAAAGLYSILIFIYLFQLGYFMGKQDLSYCYSYITNEFYGLNEHPIYISVSFSIALLFLMIDGFKNRIINFSLFLILIFGLLILSRKGPILSFLILSFVLLLFKKEKRQLYGLFLVFISLFISSLLVPEIRNRFKEVLEMKSEETDSESSSGIRKILWETSSKLIQDSDYLGYGIGDVQATLSNQLANDGFSRLAKENYNAHNQFLQIGLGTGIAGVCLFLFSFFYFLYRFNKRKNGVAIVFFILFTFVFLYESFLERQNGIIIYSFATALFIYSSEFDTNQKNAK